MTLLTCSLSGVPLGRGAWRRSPRAPEAVLAASGLLAAELIVQIPFVGPSALQAVLGTVAVGLGGLALHARRSGWRSG
jgi:hypothetical protein